MREQVTFCIKTIHRPKCSFDFFDPTGLSVQSYSSSRTLREFTPGCPSGLQRASEATKRTNRIRRCATPNARS